MSHGNELAGMMPRNERMRREAPRSLPTQMLDAAVEAINKQERLRLGFPPGFVPEEGVLGKVRERLYLSCDVCSRHQGRGPCDGCDNGDLLRLLGEEASEDG